MGSHQPSCGYISAKARRIDLCSTRLLEQLVNRLFFGSCPVSCFLNSCYLRQQARIHPTVVKKLLQLHWNKDPAADGAKINPDAAVLTAEYLRLFVIGEGSSLDLRVAVFSDEAHQKHAGTSSTCCP